MPAEQHNPSNSHSTGDTDQQNGRAVALELDAILNKEINVLDHGFIRVIDYMGNDDAIVQAARVSYGKGTKTRNSDAGLINYLMRHRHTTPFEMCELKIHVKLPIFVARQWIRHRTASVNEYSARYSIIDREFYVPDPQHLKTQRIAKSLKKQTTKNEQNHLELFDSTPKIIGEQSKTNKQGRSGQITSDLGISFIERIKRWSETAHTHYHRLINPNNDDGENSESQHGLARELARVVLPLNTYTQMYWKVNLHNLFHFIALRADSHAQYEIRVYADVLLDVVRRWVPLAHAAFVEHRLEAASLSRTQLEVVRRRLAGEAVDQAASGLSAREWAELQQVLNETSGRRD